METSLTEHFRNIKSGEIEISVVAVHVLKEKHNDELYTSSIKASIKQTRMNKLITKNRDYVINFEILPADHLTRRFLNSVEGNRSAPTRNLSLQQSVIG